MPTRDPTPEQLAAWETGRRRRHLKITLSDEGRAALQEVADEWGETLSGAVEGLALAELREQAEAKERGRKRRAKPTG